jgi:hypothetical protein
MIQAQIDEEKFEHRQKMKIRTMSSPKISLHTMGLREGLARIPKDMISKISIPPVL